MRPKYFEFPPGLTNSVNRHFIIWLTFEKLKKFVLTWTGHDRLACMGKPKKIFYKKNFPLFCCVRTRNSQFVEKHVLVSHFCSLLSLIFCNKSEQCSLFSQQSHTNKCIMARQLVADQLMSTCPPTHVSVHYGFLKDYANRASHMMKHLICSLSLPRSDC